MRLSSWFAQLVAAAWYSYRGLFAWLSPVNYVIEKVIAPLGSVTFFTLVGITGRGPASASFFVIGNSILAAGLNGVFAIPRAVEDERQGGTLSYLLISPASRSAVFLGRALVHIVDASLTVILALVWGVLLFDLAIPSGAIDEIALLSLVAAVAAAGLGLCLGSISLITLGSIFLGNIALMGLGLLTGANVPRSELGPLFGSIGNVLPLTRTIEAARLLVRQGSDADVTHLIFGDLLLAAAYAVVGLFLFRYFEHRSRQLASAELI